MWWLQLRHCHRKNGLFSLLFLAVFPQDRRGTLVFATLICMVIRLSWQPSISLTHPRVPVCGTALFFQLGWLSRTPSFERYQHRTTPIFILFGSFVGLQWSEAENSGNEVNLFDTDQGHIQLIMPFPRESAGLPFCFYFFFSPLASNATFLDTPSFRRRSARRLRVGILEPCIVEIHSYL